MKSLPMAMRIPRKAKTHSAKAWWYISPNTIEVLVEDNNRSVHQVVLTRAQLKRALEVMSVPLQEKRD